MALPRILIVEDEPGLIQSLEWYFKREGYDTYVANDGQEGLRKARTLLPEVILLDVMLPSMSGLEVCRELRSGEKTKQLPIILITAKSEESDQIEGLSVGADDYITKPFSNKILLQRIRNILRRTSGIPESGDVIEHLGVRIDRVRHQAMCNNKQLDLTPTEFRLLECLVRQPGRAFARAQLMDAAIGEGSIVLERTIDVHIKTLRKKLAATGCTQEFIETVRGIGYRFREVNSSENGTG
jgi:two-component system, OmpR family, phosphate regulon response regulator PhoB